MTHSDKQRIALFSGAFDPPHLGHRAVCEWLATSGQFDAVWIVPSFAHPYGKPMALFDHRLAMCKLQFGDIPRTVISTIERNSGYSYTYDLLSFLKIKCPKYHFTLIVGSDSYADLANWKNGESLRHGFDILQVPRGGWANSPFPTCSSTEIRKRIAAGCDEKEIVGEQVMNYIRTHTLYENSPHPHQL